MYLPPLRRVRLVRPVLAPLRDIVRQSHALVTFVGTPGLLIVAPQTFEVCLLGRPPVAALYPLVVVRVELVAVTAKIQFLPFLSVTNKALRIACFQFLHIGDLLSLLFVPSKFLVALDPVVALMVFIERGELEAVALRADSAVNQYLAVHGPFYLLDLFMTSRAIKVDEGLLHMHLMPRRLVGSHVAMTSIAYDIVLVAGG